jgi:hypothetical protein
VGQGWRTGLPPTPTDRSSPNKLKNPIAFTKISISQASDTFLGNYVGCHGDNGKALIDSKLYIKEPDMGLILNTILLTLLLQSHILAACYSDKRPPKTSTEAVMSITLDQAQIKSGEPATLHIKLTNALKRPSTVMETSVEREFEIHLTDLLGRELPLTEQGKNLRGKGKFPAVIYRNFALTLAPGENLKGDEDIAKIYLLTVLGDYKASVCRVVVELGPILSNTVSLTVR